jgi:hypothetical protein
MKSSPQQLIVNIRPATTRHTGRKYNEIRAMRHPPRRIMQTPCSPELFPSKTPSVPMLTPGSEAFARQGIPRPTPASARDLRRLAAGQSIRNVSAPPDNHAIVRAAALARLQDSLG